MPARGGLGTVDTELGYLSSCWAKADEPKTLAAFHRLRPAALPAHPLALWVCDRLIRDTGKAPDRASLKAALKAFQNRGNFWVRDDESGLWLSNGKVGVAFLPGAQGAAVASLYNIETGTECIFKKPAAWAPWSLRVLKPSPDGKTWPGLVSAFPLLGTKENPNLSWIEDLNPHAVEAKWDLKQSPSALTLFLEWQPVTLDLKARFKVDATVTMSSDSPLLHWRVNVHHTAGDDYSLVSVSFPVIQSLSAPQESDLFFSWGGRGRGHLLRKTKGWDNDQVYYPHGLWTLQFFSLSFGPDTALYFACHDGAANTKGCSILGKGGTYISHACWERDKFEMSYDVVLGPIKGDWYDAAKLYRQWALQQKWCAAGSLQQRAQQGTVARHVVETDFWIRPTWTGYALWKEGPGEVEDNVGFFLQGKNPHLQLSPQLEALASGPARTRTGTAPGSAQAGGLVV